MKNLVDLFKYKLPCCTFKYKSTLQFIISMKYFARAWDRCTEKDFHRWDVKYTRLAEKNSTVKLVARRHENVQQQHRTRTRNARKREQECKPHSVLRCTNARNTPRVCTKRDEDCTTVGVEENRLQESSRRICFFTFPRLRVCCWRRLLQLYRTCYVAVQTQQIYTRDETKNAKEKNTNQNINKKN